MKKVKTGSITYHVVPLKVASRRLTEAAKPVEGAHHWRSSYRLLRQDDADDDEDDDVTQSDDGRVDALTAAAPAPSTDALHAGEECGRT